MTITRSRDLVVAGLLAAVIVYGVAQVGYGALPPLPVAAGATLLAIAVIDGALAIVMRPRVHRRPGVEPPDPMMATRLVALAKASSLAGAIMFGVWSGLLAFLLPMYANVQAARSDTTAAVVGLISAGCLVAAGLWLEYSLRNPDEPEEDEIDGD